VLKLQLFTVCLDEKGHKLSANWPKLRYGTMQGWIKRRDFRPKWLWITSLNSHSAGIYSGTRCGRVSRTVGI